MKFAAPLAVSLALSTSLGGCAGSSGGSVNSDLAQIIATAQQLAVAACAYLPTAAAIEQILATGNASVATGQAVAQVVCAAVAQAQATTSSSVTSTRRAVRALPPGVKPVWNGIVITGKFVS